MTAYVYVDFGYGVGEYYKDYITKMLKTRKEDQFLIREVRVYPHHVYEFKRKIHTKSRRYSNNRSCVCNHMISSPHSWELPMKWKNIIHVDYALIFTSGILSDCCQRVFANPKRYCPNLLNLPLKWIILPHQQRAGYVRRNADLKPTIPHWADVMDIPDLLQDTSPV